MVTLTTMYPPQVNSPAVSMASGITVSGTTVTVTNADTLPDAPCLLVFGGDSDSPETVLMTAKNVSTNQITVTRAVEGVAREWLAGVTVARLFTAADLSAVQENIESLNNGKAETSAIPPASNTAPTMAGSASAGSGAAYSRYDHRHPTDTSRQDKITANGLLKGDGSGSVSAAQAGTDYLAPSVNIMKNNVAQAMTASLTAMSETDLSTSQVRNIYAGTADMTAGSTALATGVIYLVYE